MESEVTIILLQIKNRIISLQFEKKRDRSLAPTKGYSIF